METRQAIPIAITLTSTYTPQATTLSPATPATITVALASAYTPQATTTQSPATPAITITMAST